MKALIELCGWYGAIAILAAYALVSFAIIEPASVWYQLLNVTGAVGIVVVSFHKKAYQPGVLNLVWAAIAAIAIWHILMRNFLCPRALHSLVRSSLSRLLQARSSI